MKNYNNKTNLCNVTTTPRKLFYLDLPKGEEQKKMFIEDNKHWPKAREIGRGCRMRG